MIGMEKEIGLFAVVAPNEECVCNFFFLRGNSIMRF